MMPTDAKKVEKMLKDWKGDSYAFGAGALDTLGGFARSYGTRALLVMADLGLDWVEELYGKVTRSLQASGVSYDVIPGAAPNAPREDVYRIANEVSKARPDCIVAVGGGSTIDACKCASVLSTYAAADVSKHLAAPAAVVSTVEPFFGTGLVSQLKAATSTSPLPVVAVQTIASSGAHLTKYSNITDPMSGQKKLIVDEAVVPPAAVFDYSVTVGAPKGLTLDGGLDGIAHMWEVFMGASGKDYYAQAEDIASEGIRLIVQNLPTAVRNPQDLEARVALGYGTDLGGYAIMIGGTNGPHLGSFSLVDVLSHGRACAVLNPYYTVLFAPAIQDQLRSMGAVFKDAGVITQDLEELQGGELGEAVARGMLGFLTQIGYPTSLGEAGVSRGHIDRMIEAAKNPQLESKLKNMPTPMDPTRGDVDRYMAPVLEAAYSGDLSQVRSMSA
ncbi:MAG: iron-containing alcohol dehydrogenase [Chloroflexota bacterium]